MTNTKHIKYSDLPRNKYGHPSVTPEAASEIGRLSQISPEMIAAASRIVTDGKVFPLDAKIGAIDPPLFSRGKVRRTHLEPREKTFMDDVYDNFYPQSNSQWDAFGHIAYAKGEFYGGAKYEEVAAGERCTILPIAQRGVVGRGILIDVEGANLPGYHPAESYGVTVDQLRQILDETGQEIRRGDILVLHTGFLRHHIEQPLEHRVKQSVRTGLTAAGLEHTEEMAEFLWDAQVSAIVGDNPSVEVYPGNETPEAWPFGFLHHTLLGNLGIPIGELWWLHDLAQDCRSDSKYEFFLASAPTPYPDGFGSPANALAMK